MNQYEIVKSIYHKLIAKCPVETCRKKFTKQPITQYSLRCNPEAHMTSGHSHDLNGTQLYLLMSKYYTTAIQTNLSQNVRFLNFNSDIERKNAWASYHTKFSKFCISLDESTKLAPYMDDYTEPWTDERFKRYFGLTDIEWQLIDTVIKD